MREKIARLIFEETREFYMHLMKWENMWPENKEKYYELADRIIKMVKED